MIALDLIGIGTGNPDHLTRQAEAALRAADLILLPMKGAEKTGLADLRRAICAGLPGLAARIVEFDLPRRADRSDYLGAVEDWHDAIAATWAGLIAAHLPRGGRVALMVWGDPSLYDSSLRIAGRLGARGMALRCSVVPGITSLQVLCAEHRIPLNDLGAPVVITTGRRVRAQGWPPGTDSVAVMLDAGGAFAALPPEGVTIWWGGCLGLPEQVLEHGPLAEAGPRILRARAGLRDRLGWVMDIYLMRRGARHG